MTLIIYNPTTASQRNLIALNTKELNKKPLLKNKIKGHKNCCGKGHKKSVVAKSKGGGVKKSLRNIDFYNNNNTIGVILGFEYDPNRTSCIAAVFDFLTSTYFYTIAPENSEIGDILQAGQSAQLRLGHTLNFTKIPVGSTVHNVSLNGKSKLSRAAGCFSLVFSKTVKSVGVQISSGKKMYLPLQSFATLGAVSNKLHFLKTSGKAGRLRWLNKRQKVRGVAKNPVDHYNGGGEGKKSGRARIKWRAKTSTSKTRLTLNF